MSDREPWTEHAARCAIYSAIERSLAATDASGQPFCKPTSHWQIRCAPEDFDAVMEAAETIAGSKVGGSMPDAVYMLCILPDPTFPVGVIHATPHDISPVTVDFSWGARP